MKHSIKNCEICGAQFETKDYGNSRKYCFNCVPENANARERTVFRRQALKKEGVKRLGGKCIKCGEARPYLLAFHHLDPTNKEDTPSRMMANSQIQPYFNEISKCVLLCCNCHTEFHYLEANNHITIEEYLDLDKS